MDLQHQQMYQHSQQQHPTYYPSSTSSSNRSSPKSFAAEPDPYSQQLHLTSAASLPQNHFTPSNPYRRTQARNNSYSALQVTTSTSQSSNSDQDSEPTARPSNAHVHAQFHSQTVALSRPAEDSTTYSSHPSDSTAADAPTDASDKDYTSTTPGLSRGLSRPLTPEEQKRLEELDKLKFFLATAPSRWTSGSSALSGNPANSGQLDTMSLVSNQAPSHPALNRFQLPSGEYVTCVLWNGLYHITGTDIVRALVFRFEAFGRPVRNMKKFEEGVFSDLRNLKPGIDACLEEPKSQFLDLLFKYQCIRTQKKQKVFYWFSVPHDRLFLDALERDLKREKMSVESTTHVVGEPALSFTYDHKRSLYEQFSKASGKNENEGELEAAVRRAIAEVPSVSQSDEASMDGQLVGPNGLPVDDNDISDADDTGMSSHGNTDDEGKQRPSAIQSSKVFDMFTLFEGSPTYKQRRKKTPRVGSNLGPAGGSFSGRGSGDESMYYDRGRSVAGDRYGSHSVSASRERMIGMPGTMIDEFTGTAFAGAGMHAQRSVSAADMFMRQARGELGERKHRVHGSVGDVGMYYAEPTSMDYMQGAHGQVASGLVGQRPRSQEPVQRHIFPISSSAFTSNHQAQHPQVLSQGSFDGMNAHSVNKIKAYVCPLYSCQRLFKRMEHLKRHLRTHTMERPYTCPQCGKKFSRSDNLNQHYRTHQRPDGSASGLVRPAGMTGGSWNMGISNPEGSMEGSAAHADPNGRSVIVDDGDDAYNNGVGMFQGEDLEGFDLVGQYVSNLSGAEFGPGGLDMQMCEVEVQGEFREAYGEDGELIPGEGAVTVPYMNGQLQQGHNNDGYYSTPPTAAGPSFTSTATAAPGATDYTDISTSNNDTQWAIRSHHSPAFSNASAPSPPSGSIPLSRNNRGSLSGAPVGYTRPSPPMHSHSASGSPGSSIYGNDEYGLGTSMSAPSHKQVFDHSSMYFPSVLDSSAGAIRRHRSMTPSVIKNGEPIRRPLTASSDLSQGSPGSSYANSRAYHPYAYGHHSASHSRSGSTQSSPHAYSIPLASENATYHAVRRSESRNSNYGALPDQMRQMMSMQMDHSDNSSTGIYGDEMYRTDSPAHHQHTTESPAPYTTELPATYAPDGSVSTSFGYYQQQAQHVTL